VTLVKHDFCWTLVNVDGCRTSYSSRKVPPSASWAWGTRGRKAGGAGTGPAAVRLPLSTCCEQSIVMVDATAASSMNTPGRRRAPHTCPYTSPGEGAPDGAGWRRAGGTRSGVGGLFRQPACVVSLLFGEPASGPRLMAGQSIQPRATIARNIWRGWDMELYLPQYTIPASRWLREPRLDVPAVRCMLNDIFNSLCIPHKGLGITDAKRAHSGLPTHHTLLPHGSRCSNRRGAAPAFCGMKQSSGRCGQNGRPRSLPCPATIPFMWPIRKTARVRQSRVPVADSANALCDALGAGAGVAE